MIELLFLLIGLVIGFEIKTVVEKISKGEKTSGKDLIPPAYFDEIPFPSPDQYTKEQWAIIEQETQEQEDYVRSLGYPPGTNYYDVLNAEQHNYEEKTDPEEAFIVFSGKKHIK